MIIPKQVIMFQYIIHSFLLTSISCIISNNIRAIEEKSTKVAILENWGGLKTEKLCILAVFFFSN